MSELVRMSGRLGEMVASFGRREYLFGVEAGVASFLVETECCRFGGGGKSDTACGEF